MKASPSKTNPLKSEKEIKKAVKAKYTQVAQKSSSCCEVEKESPGLKKAVSCGYSASELAGLPPTLTESFAGCGNPLLLDEIKEGEIVLDLGSGAGLDCYLASFRVGEKGKVIGLDMTEAMLKKAQANMIKLGIKNVEFRKGEMEDIPLPAEAVNTIISNCVINLSPDKDRVFKESHRVLRKGGKLMISDIVTDKELPEEIKQDLSLWTSCVGGAIPQEEYLDKIKRAGFSKAEVMEKRPSSKPSCYRVSIKAIK